MTQSTQKAAEAAEKAAAEKAAKKEQAEKEKAEKAAKLEAEKAEREAKKEADKAAKAAEREAKAKAKEEEKAKKLADKEANKMPEQNGIRQPNPGTTTRTVWDLCDSLTEETGEPPVISQLRDRLPADFNEHTMKTQYAFWRKFHGIVGRLVKPEAVAPVEAAKEQTAEAQA